MSARSGPALRMEWDPRIAVAAIEPRELDDAQVRLSWGDRLTRLTLTVPEPADSGRICVRWRRSDGR